jgi:hypothetical protein
MVRVLSVHERSNFMHPSSGKSKDTLVTFSALFVVVEIDCESLPYDFGIVSSLCNSDKFDAPYPPWTKGLKAMLVTASTLAARQVIIRVKPYLSHWVHKILSCSVLHSLSLSLPPLSLSSSLSFIILMYPSLGAPSPLGACLFPLYPSSSPCALQY